MFIVKRKKVKNFYKQQKLNLKQNCKKRIKKIENWFNNNKIKFQNYWIIKIKALMI